MEKDLLVEYPFNPYNVGSPSEIRVEWQGDDEVNGIHQHQHNEVSEIHELLTRWETWYETEDVGAYMSLFDVGFIYVADMGTPNNPKDDVTLRDREERDSAIRIFSLYQDIEIELEEPPEVEVNAERNGAEVRVHYRIKGFVADGVSLEGGHVGWYAEGDFLFVLKKVLHNRRGDCEWRITRWLDKAINKEGIDKDLIRTKFAIVKKS